MKTHCLSKKLSFHTLFSVFHTCVKLFYNFNIVSYLEILFHTLCYYFIPCYFFHTLTYYFIPKYHCYFFIPQTSFHKFCLIFHTFWWFFHTARMWFHTWTIWFHTFWWYFRGRGKLCERRRGLRRGAQEGVWTGAATMPQPLTLRLILNTADLAYCSSVAVSHAACVDFELCDD